MEDKIWLHRFFDEYPDAMVIPAFKALYTKRGAEAASKVMWYIRFLHDPEHEYISKLPRKDREELLKEYCGMKKQDLTSATFLEAEKWYTDNFMSKAKQVFMVYGEKLEQAREAIKTGVIYAPTDIGVFKDSLKDLKEFAALYDDVGHTMSQEIKASKTGKMFGKDEMVRPADNGGLFR